MSTNRRVKNELKQIQQDLDGITQSTGGYVQVFQHGDDPYQYQCVMQGPDGSPYHGGIFYLDIQIPASYPLVPPRIKFTTPIWHPNVSFETGAIYLDFLTQGDQWNPIWTIQSMLLMIWSILRDPILHNNNLGAANLEAAIDYQENRQLFVNVAQNYTRIHAGVETIQQTQDRILSRLIQMGFDSVLAKSIVEQQHWNEDAAVTQLIQLLAASSDDPSTTSDSSYSFVHEFAQLDVTSTTAGSFADADDDAAVGEWVNISS